MNMNLRLPVSNLAGASSKLARAVPRTSAVASAKQSAFFAGTARQLSTLRISTSSKQRAAALIVEAAKKSVGDLSKGDLEGKVVLVGFQHLFNARLPK